MTLAQTYTIALLGEHGLLVACQPDGAREALQHEIDVARAEIRDSVERCDSGMKIIAGCTLTDDEPDDEDTIVYRGHQMGWLTDSDGTPRNFAVKAQTAAAGDT